MGNNPTLYRKKLQTQYASNKQPSIRITVSRQEGLRDLHLVHMLGMLSIEDIKLAAIMNKGQILIGLSQLPNLGHDALLCRDCATMLFVVGIPG